LQPASPSYLHNMSGREWKNLLPIKVPIKSRDDSFLNVGREWIHKSCGGTAAIAIENACLILQPQGSHSERSRLHFIVPNEPGAN